MFVVLYDRLMVRRARTSRHSVHHSALKADTRPIKKKDWHSRFANGITGAVQERRKCIRRNLYFTSIVQCERFSFFCKHGPDSLASYKLALMPSGDLNDISCTRLCCVSSCINRMLCKIDFTPTATKMPGEFSASKNDILRPYCLMKAYPDRTRSIPHVEGYHER